MQPGAGPCLWPQIRDVVRGSLYECSHETESDWARRGYFQEPASRGVEVNVRTQVPGARSRWPADLMLVQSTQGHASRTQEDLELGSEL